MRFEEMKQWLGTITRDQNIEDLGEVIRPVMNGRRRWWRSQVLQPTLNIGYYNPLNGKYVFGSETSAPETITVVNTTSQASYTLTCPAGHKYRVTMASVRDDTRGPSYEATYTPFGGDAVIVRVPGAMTAAVANAVIGGDGGTGTQSRAGWSHPLAMATGDALQIEIINFVAADVVRHEFIIEDL